MTRMLGDESHSARGSDADGSNGEVEELREHQRAWEEFASCAVRLIPVLNAQMASVTGETERAAMELLIHLRALASSEAGLNKEERAASLSKVVMAMQFQDITRQKLEHVGQALNQLMIQLRALLKGPQNEEAKAQLAVLQQIELNYTMEEERRLHVATVSPEYQEPVPVDVEAGGAEKDAVTLF
ncbi:MAG: hypothetical protein NW202_10650 [Nitrospira sp.]|nr:hypothetical protein [Nitrospira sp.]